MKSANILLILLLPALAWAGTMTKTKNLAMPAEGISTLVINCGTGSLSLKGDPDQDQIVITAQIEVEDIGRSDFQEFLQKNVRLSLEKKGDKALLYSNIVQMTAAALEARISLNIEIPEALHVDITDGSGSISVSTLHSNLEIDDDTGSIKIQNITGEVRIGDSSGSIAIEEITGNVFVIDGSGSIAIESVRGDLNIKDGSGSLTIVEIDGYVTVSDGSGSIDIHDVTKNVFIVIREEGSGIVEVEGVKGKVAIRP